MDDRGGVGVVQDGQGLFKTPLWQVPAILAVTATVMGFLWLLPVRSSLWLDEAVTAWIVGGTYDEMVARGSEFSGSHPFFYAIQWGFVQVFGTSELALRMPSLLAMLGAILFLFAIGRRLLDAEAGALATVLFAGNTLIQFHARDARTYGVGMFFILLSTWALLRWTDTWKWWYGAIAGAAAACIFHTHFVLSLHFGVLGLIALVRLIEARRFPWGQILLVLAVFGATIAPGVPFFIELRGRWRELVVAEKPDYDVLWRAISSYRTMGSAIVAGAVIAILFKLRIASHDMGLRVRRLRVFELLIWFAFAPFVVFALSRYTDMRLFIPRYFIGFAPAFALMFALFIRQIGPPRARLLMIALIGISLIITQRTWRHHSDDWVVASRQIERQIKAHGPMPIFFRSGLVEAKDLSWLEGGDRKSYLDSPLIHYAVSAPIVSLPYELKEAEEFAYMERILNELKDAPGMILVSRESSREFNFFIKGWMSERQDWQPPRRVSERMKITVDVYLRRRQG